MIEFAWLILVIPLIALIAALFLGHKISENGWYFAAVAVGISMLISLVIFAKVYAGETYASSMQWFLTFNVGIVVDSLSATMLLIVSFISTLVLIYSVGYMRGEKGLRRFYSGMLLFVLSMLAAVLADNLLQFFIFWELMGFCSYLLIGFYFDKKWAAAAAKKAFMVTRIGDVFLLLGILFLYKSVGSFEYSTIINAVQSGAVDPTTITIAALCIFGGVMGKSAQFPLHVWLPDAMAGPTPVSALIHAATMVKAGLYLIARLYPLFEASSVALSVMALVGAFTALFAASMAITSNDIKQILAYSTISQLAFIVAAFGVMGYVPAMFHLMNHAFFKALLFLGAGSVIHAVHSNNIWDMGGLFKKMPVTGLAMLIATLSIAGIPPLSGFWSKDEILVKAMENNSLVFAVLIVTALMTAFYMFRMFFVVFCGKPRWPQGSHPHESPVTMTLPLVFLAILAATSGFFGSALGSILVPDFHIAFHGYLVIVISISVAVSGTVLAYLIYNRNLINPEQLIRVFPGVHRTLSNRYYIDSVYDDFATKVVTGHIARTSYWFDLKIIDGIVDGLSKIATRLARFSQKFDHVVIDGFIRSLSESFIFAGSNLRKMAVGKAQSYLAWQIAGLIVLILIFIYIGGGDGAR